MIRIYTNDNQTRDFYAVMGKYFASLDIAKELVAEIVSDHTDKPIKCVADNPYALKIFHSLGFEEVGQNGKYKKLIKY